MSKAIYRTRDKRLMPSIDSGDIETLKDVLYYSDDGEFSIEYEDLKRLKGNIEPELFKVLKETVEFVRPLAVTFRIY